MEERRTRWSSTRGAMRLRRPSTTCWPTCRRTWSGPGSTSTPGSGCSRCAAPGRCRSGPGSPASVRSPWPARGGRTPTWWSRQSDRRSSSSTRKPSWCGGAGSGPKARYEHRYEIAPDGTGSRVVYRLRQTAITDPPLRMRAPLMRTMTHRVMIPRFCRRGLNNLLRSAERLGSKDEVARTPKPARHG